MNEIAVRQSDDWVEMVQPMLQLSQRLAMTVFAGPMRGKPDEVFATVLYGRELGLSPAQSLQMIHVVQGRPTLSAEGHRALFLSANHRLHIIDWDDKKCTVRAERGDGLGSVEVTFTIKQAQDAGLMKNPSWRSWPQQMLLARATSMAIKAIAPDVSLGLDAQDAPMIDAPAPAPTATTVVQVGKPAADDVEKTRYAVEKPDADPAPTNVEPPPGGGAGRGSESGAHPEPTAPEPAPDPITPAQMRKLQALLSDLERLEGRKLDRQERRDMIANLAGVEQLATAKDLTKDQARAAIDALGSLITAAEAVVTVIDAEIVDEAQ